MLGHMYQGISEMRMIFSLGYRYKITLWFGETQIKTLSLVKAALKNKEVKMTGGQT